MTEIYNRPASQIVLEAKREILRNKKDNLQQELATAALELLKIDQELEKEPVPLTFYIRTAYYEFHDDGYLGGYRESAYEPAKSLKITTSHFEIAFLGALSKHSSTFGRHELPGAPRYDERDENISISLQRIQIDETSKAEAPSQAVQDTFKACQDVALEIVDHLEQTVRENNPYQEIPIKINKRELHQALLKMEILKYCQANDPNFHIEELPRER